MSDDKRKEYLKHPDVLCDVCGDFISHAECNSLCQPTIGIHAVNAILVICKKCASINGPIQITTHEDDRSE